MTDQLRAGLLTASVVLTVEEQTALEKPLPPRLGFQLQLAFVFIEKV